MGQRSNTAGNGDPGEIGKQDFSPETSAKKRRKAEPKPRKPRTAPKESKAQNLLDEIDIEDFDPSFLDEFDVDLLDGDQPNADPTPLVSTTDFPALTSAIMVLSLLDGLVTMALGPKYAMTKDERKMMADPLDRMMKRLPVNISEQYGRFVDPALFVMGLVAWGSRIARIRKEENEPPTDRPPRRPPDPQPSPGPAPSQTTFLPEQMSAPSDIIMGLDGHGAHN